MKDKERYTIIFFLSCGVIVSMISLYKNIMLIYDSWIDISADVPFLKYVFSILEVWWVWLPSILVLFICSILLKRIYVHGDFKTAIIKFLGLE